MIIKQIWTGNAYRNFNYLIACPETGEAMAIDPLDHEKCLDAAKARGWQITQVLNTHEHFDHIGGNEKVIAATGNCHHGGHPEELYGTFAGQLAQLADNTRIYPGHDYLVNNLEFTLNREPDNEQARDLLGNVRDQDPNAALVSTLAMEKEINTFFRLHSPTVIARLREAFPDLPEQPDPGMVFLKLRELRNSW